MSSRPVLHSLFPVCSDRFALIIVFFFLLPCSLFCLFPLRSCFCRQFDLCSLLISLFFFVTIALLDSHHLEYRYSPCSELGMQSLVTPLERAPRIDHATLLSFHFRRYRIPLSHTAPPASRALFKGTTVNGMSSVAILRHQYPPVTRWFVLVVQTTDNAHYGYGNFFTISCFAGG